MERRGPFGFGKNEQESKHEVRNRIIELQNEMYSELSQKGVIGLLILILSLFEIVLLKIHRAEITELLRSVSHERGSRGFQAKDEGERGSRRV